MSTATPAAIDAARRLLIEDVFNDNPKVVHDLKIRIRLAASLAPNDPSLPYIRVEIADLWAKLLVNISFVP